MSKFCANCGKENGENVNFCLSCGSPMNNNVQQVNTPVAKNKGGKVPAWAIVLIVFSCFFWVVVLFSDTEIETESDNSSPTSSETTREYISIDIDELEDALDANAALAKDTYNNKYLEITGRLGVIDSDLKYIGLYSTTDTWDITGVHCNIKNSKTRDKVKTLTKDQTIVVRGKITNVGEVLGYYLDIDEIVTE